MAPYVDALGSVRTWINSLSVPSSSLPALVGMVGLMPKGAHLHRLRSPFKSAYAVLSLIGGSLELIPETPFYRGRVSADILGLTKEGANAAAIGYANWVYSVRTPIPMGMVYCQFTDALSGPLDLTILEKEPRFVVDADFYFIPTN
jgi:hypothetical protein